MFTVPLGVDITQKVTVPLNPQLDNVEKVTLMNINVPSGKKVSFKVEFEGCAKRKLRIPLASFKFLLFNCFTFFPSDYLTNKTLTHI